MKLFDLFHHGIELLSLCAIHNVWEVDADHGLIRGHHHDFQVVDFVEFHCFRVSRPCHAG